MGKVVNGINTVHLSYVREGTGHALIGARAKPVLLLQKNTAKREDQPSLARPGTGVP
jgi:hypothetical protein